MPCGPRHGADQPRHPEPAGALHRPQQPSGAATATRHLLELGHRHIAFLSSDHAIEDALLRHQGYQDALAEAGLSADPELVESGMPNEEGGSAPCSTCWARGCPSRLWWPTTMPWRRGHLGAGGQRLQGAGGGLGGGVR